MNLVAAWTRACAFVRDLGVDELHEQLTVLQHLHLELEQLAIVTALASRRTEKPRERKALAELTRVLGEFEILKAREEELSVVPSQRRLGSLKPQTILAAPRVHRSFLRAERDYKLAEANVEFRTRKRRAVEALKDVLPRAEAEVLAAVAKDLKKSAKSGGGRAVVARSKKRKPGGTRRRSDLDLRACGAVASLEERRVDWKPKDVASLLGIRDVRSLTGTKRSPGGKDRVHRCPAFMKLWAKQKRTNAK